MHGMITTAKGMAHVPPKSPDEWSTKVPARTKEACNASLANLDVQAKAPPMSAWGPKGPPPEMSDDYPLKPNMKAKPPTPPPAPDREKDGQVGADAGIQTECCKSG